MESYDQIDVRDYINTRLDYFLEPLGKELKKHKPDNLCEFTLNWARETYAYRASKNENDRLELEFLRTKVPELERNLKECSTQNIPHLLEYFGRFDSIKAIQETDSEWETDSSEDDDTFMIPEPCSIKTLTVEQALSEVSGEPSRFSISGEKYGVYNKKSSFKPVFINKDNEVRERIKQRLKNHWMFNKLDEDAMLTLIDTMRQENYAQGDVVIMEGDTGNSLYIVDQGEFDCVKIQKHSQKRLLKVYTEGELFGELALMYNWPRTAMIIAKSNNCCTFSLDRQTFNYIISDTKDSEKYMKMLSKVPILNTFDQYQMTKILDACKHVEYNQGEYVIIEGEIGNEFFILLEGEAMATKHLETSQDLVKVKSYKSGDYFGERAILKNVTRAANIVAVTNIKCLMLDRDSFNNLLGPIEHILKRNMKIYINYMK